ncbi:hypothetical protein FHETE_6088 [Fusarium heterosporum]|uniref:Uncharacterized protein n=1 Tax=Fusarium heterosporum TaxID=42747 RepID=A0A8H5WQU7_FUSHE|nr:hypothetical protein FHETE_6088 [Fusarium heterosporum]
MKHTGNVSGEHMFCPPVYDLPEEAKNLGISGVQTNYSEICNVIYGAGNPDISGIGVAVGYVLEIVLNIFLSLAVILLKRKRKTYPLYQVVKAGPEAFFGSAAYFALALQLATIVVLVRKDYGISTADLGAIEARISQSVFVASMMPLLYPVALLEPATNASIRSNEDMSENMGEEYDGEDWDFGQIVSIVLFIPVAVEMAYRWRFGPAYGGDEWKVRDEKCK